MRRAVWLLAIALLCQGRVFAQRDLGAILGTVSETTGAVVPGAEVTITEEATKLTYRVTTDAAGNYSRPLLKPGNYSVEAEARGFKKAVQHNIVLTAGDRVQANLTLQVGVPTQTIEVNAAPPALQTESAIIGGHVNDRQASVLPLGGQRKFLYLARLSPEIVPGEPGSRDANSGAISANGVRSNGQNNFLLNGVDNNANTMDLDNKTAYVVGPSVEAIGELRIMANGYNAEYGCGAGAVVNVTLKSGGNDIHGSLFEFLQNDKLDANKWEFNRAGIARPALRQNQFGAAVGGPIMRNKTFWFADYQGTRIVSAGGVVAGLGNSSPLTIPISAFKNGDFSSLLTGKVLGTDAAGNPVPQGAIFDPLSTHTVNGKLVRNVFPNNQILANRWDAAASALINLYPNPNINLGNRIPNSNYANLTQGNQQVNQGDVRIDHRLSETDYLFGSFSWSHLDLVSGSALPGALGSGESQTSPSGNVMASYTRVWSFPALVCGTTTLTKASTWITRLPSR